MARTLKWNQRGNRNRQRELSPYHDLSVMRNRTPILPTLERESRAVLSEEVIEADMSPYN